MHTLDTLSAIRLRQTHPHIQTAMERLLHRYPFQVVYALRTRDEQWQAFNDGNSKIKGDADYPHMPRPDGVQAIDLRPINSRGPISWDVKNPEIAAAWAWFISIAYHTLLDYVETVEPGAWGVVSGMNWDGDLDILTDQSFDDYGHLEIRRKNASPN